MTDIDALLRSAASRLPEPPLDEAALAEWARRDGLLDVAIGAADTPVGRLILAVTEAGVAACSYEPEDAVLTSLARRISPRILRSPGQTDGVRRELDDYFAGRRQHFDTPVDLRLAAPFGREVLRGVTAVSYGYTTTYGRLAAELGKPRAARAVGHALGANPVCIIVPCHRVVGATGALTGYAGGVDAKRLLLEIESALPHKGSPVQVPHL